MRRPILLINTNVARPPVSPVGLEYVGETLVIVKRELFMGWYILYPVGLTGLILLQLAVKYISSKALL